METGKTRLFSCSIIYWCNSVRLLNRLQQAGEISYQWRLMNMYLLYTRRPSWPKWSHTVRWRWQLCNSFHANIIQYNVVISLGKAQASVNIISIVCCKPHQNFGEELRHKRWGFSTLVSPHRGITKAESVRSSVKKTCLLRRSAGPLPGQQTRPYTGPTVSPKQLTYQYGLWFACLFWYLTHTSSGSSFQVEYRIWTRHNRGMFTSAGASRKKWLTVQNPAIS